MNKTITIVCVIIWINLLIEIIVWIELWLWMNSTEWNVWVNLIITYLVLEKFELI